MVNFDETEPVDFDDTEEIVEPVEEQSTMDVAIDKAKAVGLGAVEGIPFAKDALSAGEALLDEGNFGEQYQRNKAEWDKSINEAEEKHPIAFNVGDIGAGFALPAARGLKGMMLLGAASGFSRSEDRDIWDAVSGAGIGGVFGKAGQKVGQGIQLVGKKLGILGVETTKDILTREGSKEGVNQHIRKWFMDEVDDLASGSVKFSDYVLEKKVGGRPLITGEDIPDTIRQKAGTLMQTAGKQLDEVISEIDYKLPKSEVVGVYTKLRQITGIDDLLNSTSEAAVNQGKKLEKLLKSEFFEETGEFVEKKLVRKIGDQVEEVVESVPKIVPKQFNLKDLVSNKRFYADQASVKHLNGVAVPKNENSEFWGNLTKGLSGLVPELAENTGKVDKLLLRSLNRDYATGKLIHDTTKQLADKAKAGVLDKLKDLFKVRSLMFTVGAVGGAAFGGAPAAVVGAATGTLMALASDPRSPQKYALGLKRLATNLDNPAYEKYLQKLSVASSLSSDIFRDTLSGISSKIMLQDKPLARTTDAVLENADELLNIANMESPEVANQLREALESKDEDRISALMESLEEFETVKDILEPGTGFNGKVFNPEKKAELAQKVEAMDISRKQKSMLKKELIDNGVVPQVQQEPERFLKYKSRDKNKPNY